MKKFSYFFLALLVLCAVFLVLDYGRQGQSQSSFKGISAASYDRTVTNSSTTVGTTTTRIAAANSNRIKLVICNDSAKQFYCAEDTTSTLNAGIPLNNSTSSTNTCYKTEWPDVYLGQVSCIGSATGSVTILEK